MPESVQSCFELSIHLSVYRSSRELLLKIARGKTIQGYVHFVHYKLCVEIYLLCWQLRLDPL